MKAQALVIGAGISGLATAGLLARRGFAVTVVDKNESIGGRIGEISDSGFRFETGPSWYLMPEAYDQFFRIMGTSTAAQLSLSVLDPGYRVWTDVGEYVDVPRGADKVAELFESIEPGAGARLRSYLASAHLVYSVALSRFLYTTFRSPSAFFHPEVLRRSGHLLRFLLVPLQQFVEKQFQDHRLRKILQYPAVFLSTQPSTAPSMYHLMSHTDLELGVRYPTGGFRAIVDAVAQLAHDHGVRFELGSEVVRLDCADRTDSPRRSSQHHRSMLYPGAQTDKAHIKSVEVRTADGSQTYYPDLVVSTADLHHTETVLLPRKYQSYPETYFAKKDPGIGVVLAMLGIRGALPELAHHSLLLSPEWQRDFSAVFSAAGALPENKSSLSLYVCKPSATDTTVAPAGHENLFVLVPTAPDLGIGYGSGDHAADRNNVAIAQQESPAVTAIVDKAVARIAQVTGINDLAERIVVRHTLAPGDFAKDFHAWRGGALGPAHTLGQSAMFRPQNKSKKLSNLYYAGATVAPGVGVPMCLISAENVLKRIDGRTDSRPMLADEVLHGSHCKRNRSH